MSLISVVVPVYNAEKYLNRCIDSILNQSYADFELILIDDGSTDSSAVILDAYAKSDSRCVVKHKENGGHASARNAGIDIAFLSDSEYITFIDSDDWVDKNYLEYLYLAITESKSQISACSYRRVKDVSEVKDNDEGCNITVYSPEDLWCKDRITATIPCAKLYSKSLFDGVRWPNKVHDDEHMTYKLLFKGDKLPFIDLKLYNYYYNTESVMVSNWSPKRVDSVYAIEERREFFKERFPCAYELDNKLYIEELYDTLCSLEPIKRDNKKLYSELRSKLKNELRTRGEKYGYGWNNARYMWLYAFPYMKAKNFFEMILGKVFKEGNR